MTTPVAIFLSTDSDRIRRILREVAQVRPRQLFLISDGPQKSDPDAAQHGRENRAALVRLIDWPCEVYQDFSDTHCGEVSRHVSGLTWLFEHVPEAIIIEDVCVPHSDFFRFAEEMLQRYRHDERVMHVNGMTSGRDAPPPEVDYSFTDFNETQAWATWRRAWQHYDLTVGLWPELRAARRLHALFPRRKSLRRYFERVFETTCKFLDRPMHIPAWEPQWAFTCWANHGLGIIPATSLAHASPSVDADPAWLSRNLLPALLRHPTSVLKDPVGDLHYLDQVLSLRIAAASGRAPAPGPARVVTPSGGSSSANSDFACARTSAA